MSDVSKLRKGVREGQLLRLRRRPRAAQPLMGVCVGIGREWGVLATVSDHVFLNGHSFFRLADITAIRATDPAQSTLLRGLKHLGDWPPQALNDAGLDTVQDVVATAVRRAPLITVATERLHPDEVYIGVPVKFGKRKVHLNEVDPDAQWGRESRYAWKDISLVEINQRYESVLAALAGPPPRQ